MTFSEILFLQLVFVCQVNIEQATRAQSISPAWERRRQRRTSESDGPGSDLSSATDSILSSRLRVHTGSVISEYLFSPGSEDYLTKYLAHSRCSLNRIPLFSVERTPTLRCFCSAYFVFYPFEHSSKPPGPQDCSLIFVVIRRQCRSIPLHTNSSAVNVGVQQFIQAFLLTNYILFRGINLILCSAWYKSEWECSDLLMDCPLSRFFPLLFLCGDYM